MSAPNSTKQILDAWDTAALAFQALLTTGGAAMLMDNRDPVYRIYDKAATSAHVGMMMTEDAGSVVYLAYRRPYSVAKGE